jgi:ribosomal protein S12 methylthiotransferase accessory factor
VTAVAVGPDRLVSPLAGLVRWVRPAPPEAGSPPLLRTWVAHVADAHATTGTPADRYGTGTAFGDDDRARGAALGEAVERYCGNHVPADLVTASHDELRAAGREALDPTTLALYSDAQLAEPGCPFVPFTRDLPVRWAEGHDLATGAPVLVPGSLVWVNWFTGPRRHDPPTNFSMLAGLAAGTSPDHAQRSALEELIERDATMIWWHSGGEPLGLDVDDPRLAAWLRVPADGAVTLEHVLVPHATGVPVVGTVLRDREHDLLVAGFAARPTAAEAVLKAAGEAWSLRTYALGLLRPDGQVWQAAANGLFDGSPLKPHRADRLYADDYRSDFRDVTDLACHSQYHLDPRTRPATERRLTPRRRVALGDVATVAGDTPRAYVDLLAALGIRTVAVDVTTPDVAAAGLHVCRVVAPGLYSNPPAAFPFLGGTRLYDEPHRLGFTDRPLTEDAAVLTPLPHT